MVEKGVAVRHVVAQLREVFEGWLEACVRAGVDWDASTAGAALGIFVELELRQVIRAAGEVGTAQGDAMLDAWWQAVRTGFWEREAAGVCEDGPGEGDEGVWGPTYREMLRANAGFEASSEAEARALTYSLVYDDQGYFHTYLWQHWKALVAGFSGTSIIVTWSEVWGMIEARELELAERDVLRALMYEMCCEA
jgi:hypothetical protein